MNINVLIPTPVKQEPVLTLEESAREWRDQELQKSDEIVKIEDHPLRQNYMFYRDQLRDWPSTSNFPEVRPVFNKQPLKLLTQAAFLARFTDAEFIQIELASIDSPTATIEQRTQQAGIRKLLKEIDLASYINLDDLRILGALDLLESAGFITVERKNEILTNPVLSSERYRGSI